MTEIVKAHRRAKVVFPGQWVTVLTHKEDKETREDRKRGEPKVQVWSLVHVQIMKYVAHVEAGLIRLLGLNLDQELGATQPVIHTRMMNIWI